MARSSLKRGFKTRAFLLVETGILQATSLLWGIGLLRDKFASWAVLALKFKTLFRLDRVSFSTHELQKEFCRSELPASQSQTENSHERSHSVKRWNVPMVVNWAASIRHLIRKSSATLSHNFD